MPNRIVKELTGINFTIGQQSAWAACDTVVVTPHELYGLNEGLLALKIKLPESGYDQINEQGVTAIGLCVQFCHDEDHRPKIHRAQEVHIIHGKRPVN